MLPIGVLHGSELWTRIERRPHILVIRSIPSLNRREGVGVGVSYRKEGRWQPENRPPVCKTAGPETVKVAEEETVAVDTSPRIAVKRRRR